MVPPRAARSPAVVRTGTLVAVATLVAVLAGCAGVSPTATRRQPAAVGRGTHPESAPSTTSTTEPPPAVGPVQWVPCGDLQCGSVTVPLDYARPDGPTIEIAVARHPAEVPSERIGSLVINPGGPGASGIDDLPNELSVLTPELLDRFDIVSYDPRGVGRSSPVTCSGGSEPGTPGPPVDPVPTTPAAQRSLLRNDEAFAAQCEKYSGSILPFVGTVDSARDLDQIRAALGDLGLTFIGHSYGTLIGATYAELFPTRVRAMVLDGAIDPALTTDQYAAGQAGSLESALNAFLAWCAADTGCPWRPVGDPTTAVLDLIQQSRVRPLSASGQGTVGPGELYDALVAGLGSASQWPALATTLAQAASGDGSAAAAASSQYAAGGSSNGAEAEEAIDCLDHPVDRDPSTYPALAAQLGQAAPVFGPLLAWELLGCADWPAPPTRMPAPASDPGAPPILVVGTTGDPITPYGWAVDLAKELSGGVLLTWQGQSHVAYFYSPCVRAIDQAYLVSGTLPAAGTTCTD
jgi:pimeloyl-ACP methyl ester carboxylesterase